MIEWTVVAMALVTGFGIGAVFGMIVTMYIMWMASKRRRQGEANDE